jgi:hypothetical protein
MKELRSTAVLVAAFAASAARAQPIAFTELSGYGNFHAAGVVATVSGDADRDATAELEWRVAGEPAFRPGHPLARIAATTFAGSLFWLAPGTSYEARVTVLDPDGVNGTSQRTATFATRSDTLPEPTLRTLYVATTGDDGNAGTDPALPLRTVQRAAELARAGDLVSIAPGTYRESVTVAASGTAAQPIVFRGSAPGVVLDGADGEIAAGGAWTPEPNGVWSRLLGFPTGHVVAGFADPELGRLYRYGSLAALTALAAGPPGGFWLDGATLRLHVKLADGSSPAAHPMHVARLENGFVLDGRSFVRLENVEIRHYGSGDFGKGVYLRYASDCAVRGSRIHDVGAAGGWIKGGSRNLVEDDDFTDTSIFGWPWDATKGSSAENNGVAMTDDVGRGNVVRRNRFRGTFNGLGPCGGAAPPGGEVTTETDVYDNDFRRHTDDALEPEGWCANVRLWGNTIRDVHMAFAVAPAAPGPTWLVRNVAYGFGNTRTSQSDGYMASALKINSGYATPVGPLFIYHNTWVSTAPATDAVALLNPGQSTYVTAGNNVIAGTRYALYKVNPVLLNWNWNDLTTSDPSRYAWWMGNHYATPAQFRAATLLETNGIAEPPQLEDPAAGLFQPRAGSPLIDRGRPMPGINDGWRGTAPDIGACEWSWLRDGFESGDFRHWSGQVP